MAINQRHQEGVMVQETLAGEVAKMEASGSIANREVIMGTIDPLPGKRGDCQGIKYQEMARI